MAAWNSPWDVAPSPNDARATDLSPLYFAAKATPTACSSFEPIGLDSETIFHCLNPQCTGICLPLLSSAEFPIIWSHRALMGTPLTRQVPGSL